MSDLPFGWMRKAYPNALSGVLEAIESVCVPQARLSTPRRLAYFVAQCAHETDRFKTLREYGSIQYFTEHYEGRVDLGNTEVGDGVRFRGRGLIMTTGRYNYTQLQQATGLQVVANPELLESPEGGAMAAVYYWGDRGCNNISDQGEFTRLTKVINGGYTHLAARKTELQRVWRYLRVEL